MMRTGVLCVAALLAGCFSQPRVPEPALYDLGIAPAGRAVQPVTNAEPAAVRVQVSARSWLDDTAMHYRLVYSDEMRTHAYAYARWIAPPAEFVAQRLRQRLADSGSAAAYQLEIELEEFVQVFETPTRSFGRVVAHVRVRTSDGRADEATFAEQVAAQTPDAPGGVRALAAATATLVARVVDWISARSDRNSLTKLRLVRPAY
jgi:ABC-type uncharacterized transport system auxiliary subunit